MALPFIVDLAETRDFRAGDGAAGLVDEPSAVRVLQDHGPSIRQNSPS
jgi:hypothetical protein